MRDRPIASLTEEDKANALKTVGDELAVLERKYGPSIVRWVINRRHEERAERKRIEAEKAELDRRLAELDKS